MNHERPSAKEARVLRRLGWFGHGLVGDPQTATGFNWHTHGFNSFGHLDLQIVFRLTDTRAYAIAKTICDQIQSGKSFDDGDRTMIPHADGSEYPVAFIKVREGDREVLRVILPTPDGKLEPAETGDDSDPFYSLQWTVTAV